MTLATLNPPQDITWRRMAYSRDMIDTNFADMAFPPKWRTSLSVYYYIVPEEDTADAYPDMRVVYLKLVASITGWNPSEELASIKQQASESDQLDDLQNSVWQVIEASGWASKYWACHGAILNLGVFPGKSDDVQVDDFPYIVDFEPKKRELYEAVTEGEEVLSGSSNKTNIFKGTTTVENMELNGFSFGIPNVFEMGASGKLGGSTTSVEQKTTDTLRESRETRSRSTSSSQMYQLFNGYHIGTNRAVFVIAPRPHSVTGSFALLDGERKLEGLQDIFLVTTMPRSLKGFCIHASIDTGHKAPGETPVGTAVRTAVALRMGEFSDPPCLGGILDPVIPPTGGGGGGGGGTSTDPGHTDGFTLIVTRRMIQACGRFDDSGNLILERSSGSVGPKPPVFVGDLYIRNPKVSMAMRGRLDPPAGGFDDCRETHARMYNRNIAHISQSMVDLFSSGSATPKTFAETKTFKALFLSAASSLPFDLEDLRTLKYIDDKELEKLKKNRIQSVSDLYTSKADQVIGIDINHLRSRLFRPAR